MSSTREGIWSGAHDNALEIALPRTKSSRIAYVDNSRGILIILMLVVHSATPCIETIRETIQGLWILDIATKGFVMMAGYTLAIVYKISHPPAFLKIFRRSLELLVVMFVSNMVLTLVRLAWARELEATVAWSWFLGLLTFKTQYNISGVLLPIALLLPLIFFILQMEQRWGLVVTMSSVALSLGVLYAWSTLAAHGPIITNIIDLGFGKGVGGFPVVPYISYGVLGFLTARLITWPHTQFTWMRCGTLLLVAMTLYMASLLSSLTIDGLGACNLMPLLIKYLRTEAMFLMILTLGVTASLLCYSTSIDAPLRTLGHYALFAFIFHRLIGHTAIVIFNLHDGGYAIFVFQFTIVLTLTYLACVLRARIKSLDRFLSKLYL